MLARKKTRKQAQSRSAPPAAIQRVYIFSFDAPPVNDDAGVPRVPSEDASPGPLCDQPSFSPRASALLDLVTIAIESLHQAKAIVEEESLL